jgi:hypothetical protein
MDAEIAEFFVNFVADFIDRLIRDFEDVLGRKWEEVFREARDAAGYFLLPISTKHSTLDQMY